MSSQPISNTLSTEDAQGLQRLFSKPLEPAFTAQGNTIFDWPSTYFVGRYQTIGSDIVARLGADTAQTRIPLSQITPPDLSFTNDIASNGCFSLFNQKHREIAGRLISLFMTQSDTKSFISCCAFTKDRINPYLFQYALAVAAAHRQDTKNHQTPSILHVFPDQFVDPDVFRKLREEATLVPAESRQPVEIPVNFTASDLETEQRLAYFREDIGVNMHHWHWHLVYPAIGTPEIVNKDRRGELFYYMHSQIMARYNIERFAQQLSAARPLSNFRDLVQDGYYPKIIRSSNNRSYPGRFPRQPLQDVNRDGINVTISDMERWRDQIYQAIDQGFVVAANGQQTPLNETTGIDILGDLVEASQRSINSQLYGDLHNNGHNLLGFMHDPTNRYLEDFGVVADITTSMRDPAFYNFHAFVDDLFERFKSKLPAYNDQQLNYNGISILSVNAQISRGQNVPQNVLLTYWQKSQVDLQTGLDFGPQGNVFAQFTHLQHAPFTYRISVNNTSGNVRRGTCRIFIAPTTDDRGTLLSYNDQRQLMIEMDKFTVNLTPGVNNILRRSDESSLTVPFEQTFRAVGANAQPSDPTALARFQFCGCGWPQHMLLPRGKIQGMEFEMFAMISNFNDDSVGQDGTTTGCDTAASFCGLRDRLYPDRRSMGYPFDRVNSARTLKDFISRRTNMAVQKIQIRFSNTLVSPS